MVIKQDSSNIPDSVGRRNIPKTKRWGPGVSIARAPSARGIGRSPPLLPQVTEEPVIPILDRPHPFLDWVKNRETMVDRQKLIGQLGVVDPDKVTWPREREIATIPSVISILSGPERTLHPKKKKTRGQHLSVEW